MSFSPSATAPAAGGPLAADAATATAAAAAVPAAASSLPDLSAVLAKLNGTATDAAGVPLTAPASVASSSTRLARQRTSSNSGSGTNTPTPPRITIPAIPSSLLERRRSMSNGSATNSPRPPTPTNKLAETVVGVREVAKNIGRARVRLDEPKTVMIVCKLNDQDLIRLARDMTIWLIDDVRAADGSDISVYVDAQIRDHPLFNYAALATQSDRYATQIFFWTPEFCAYSPELIDFVITLGGDGTVLYTSWLFQNIVPPVIPFHLGSLGFLTVFDFSRYKTLLRQVFERGARVNLRMRFTCTVFQARDSQGQVIANSLPRRRCDSIKNMLAMPTQQPLPPAAPSMPSMPLSASPPQAPQALHVAASGQHAAVAAVAAMDSASNPPPLSPLSAAFAPMIEQTRRASMSLEQQSSPHSATSPTGTSTPLGARGRTSSFSSAQATTFEHNGMYITTEAFQVLNELVVDRGPSAYMSQLELFGDERHLTTVQADGLVVSTPTGSTAYSLSAGGSIVHPEVQATLVTPICPHTLSFRPMLLPDSMELKVCVPPTSRNTAWASFDGRHRIELKQGDFVSITASKFPFPTICHHDQSSDWFHSLARCLHWNERQRQKAFTGDGQTSAAGHGDDGEDEDYLARSVGSSAPGSYNGFKEACVDRVDRLCTSDEEDLNSAGVDFQFQPLAEATDSPRASDRGGVFPIVAPQVRKASPGVGAGAGNKARTAGAARNRSRSPSASPGGGGGGPVPSGGSSQLRNALTPPGAGPGTPSPRRLAHADGVTAAGEEVVGSNVPVMDEQGGHLRTWDLADMVGQTKL